MGAVLKFEDYRREMVDIDPDNVLKAYGVEGKVDYARRMVLVSDSRQLERLARELGLKLGPGAVAFPWKGWTWQWWEGGAGGKVSR